MAIITADDLRPDIREYLQGWFEKSKARQIENGITFNLSFSDFLQLWGKRRIKSLEKWMDDGSLYVKQRKPRPDDPNLTGYCLCWKSYAAKQTGVMDLDTAQIATRGKSLEDIRMKKGDKHTPEAIAKISAKLTGVPKAEDHKAAISKTMTGMKRGPMSQEEKDKRSATVKATLARKKAEKLAAQHAAQDAALAALKAKNKS